MKVGGKYALPSWYSNVRKNNKNKLSEKKLTLDVS